MCSRFTLIVTPEVLSKTFDLTGIPHIEHRYNIAPGQPVGCIRNRAGHNKLDFLTWGMSSDADISICAENLNTLPALQRAVRFNRCIIPATGFYQWLEEEGGTHPYYIRLLNSSVMGFAGFWEERTADDGHEMSTCTVLTTVSNELIWPINDRMPVILQPEDYGLWLNASVTDLHDLERIYSGYPAEQMFAHPVPNLVNIPRFDSPSCILQM